MQRTHHHFLTILASTVLSCAWTGAWAQAPEPAAMQNGLHSVEAYEESNHLSAGYGDWREFGLRGITQYGDHQLSAEASNMNRFNENGNYLGLGDTLVLSPLWYASLNLGIGDGAAYLPRYRLDGFIHRKLLSDLRLVGSLGLGRYHAPDGHQDDNASLGLTYYFERPWVVQAQARQTRSQPGRIVTSQYFIAATWGHHQATQVTGRYGWGQEGYLSLGDGLFISHFSSHQTTLSIQHWLGQDWGLKLKLDSYHNPYYHRSGLNLGVFKDFR